MDIAYRLDTSAIDLLTTVNSIYDLDVEFEERINAALPFQIMEQTAQIVLGSAERFVMALERSFTAAPKQDEDEPEQRQDTYEIGLFRERESDIRGLLWRIRESGDDWLDLDGVAGIFSGSGKVHFNIYLTATGLSGVVGTVRTEEDETEEAPPLPALLANLVQALLVSESARGRIEPAWVLRYVGQAILEHEVFHLLHEAYRPRPVLNPIAELKYMLIDEGIGWTIGHRADFAEYDRLLGLDADAVRACVGRWNSAIEAVKSGALSTDELEALLAKAADGPPHTQYAAVTGYHMVRQVYKVAGWAGFRDLIRSGPDRLRKFAPEVAGVRVAW